MSFLKLRSEDTFSEKFKMICLKIIIKQLAIEYSKICLIQYFEVPPFIEETNTIFQLVKNNISL